MEPCPFNTPCLRNVGLKELPNSRRRKLRAGKKEAERPKSRRRGDSNIPPAGTPALGRWRAPQPHPLPWKRLRARARALPSLARSSASILVTFFLNKNPRRRDTASDRTCRRRTPLRPLSARGRRSLRRPAARALLPDSELATASRAPRCAPPPPHPHPNPQPGSPAARVSMATPLPRREKKASGSSGPPPAPTEKAGRPTDASLFIFIFLRKEPARLWRICGIQHGGWSLRPPLPGALTSASRTSGSDDPPPQRRERPGSVGPLRVRRLHIPA